MKNQKAKLVVTVHVFRSSKSCSGLPLPLLNRLLTPAIKRADKIIAVSEFTKTEIIRKKKKLNLYHWVDIFLYRPIDKEKWMIIKFNLNS